MSTRTVYLSRLLGLFVLFMGLMMLVRRADFAQIMLLIAKDQALLYVTGIIALASGLAMVLAHNVWSGSVTAVAVTAIGWLSLLKGLFILFMPSGTATGVLEPINFAALANLYVVVFLIVGAYLTYAGFAATARDTHLRTS